jgi:hypothetical protein
VLLWEVVSQPRRAQQPLLSRREPEALPRVRVDREGHLSDSPGAGQVFGWRGADTAPRILTVKTTAFRRDRS